MGDIVALKEMWEEVEKRFEEKTNLTLRLKPPRTLNDCLTEIEASRAIPGGELRPDKVSNSDKAKKAGRDILYCLKLLGGVAAQGVSLVFPPSGLCFNALSLLLDVPDTLHSFHGAIDGLFETLGPSLSVFQIYERIEQFENIEPELRRAIHLLMVCFVDICALSIELRDSGRWRKWKAGMKRIMLEDDSCVNAKIERFRELTAAHTHIQGTQTLKTLLSTNSAVVEILNQASETGKQISDIYHNVTNLKESDDKRKADETSKKHLEYLKKKLDPDQKATKTSNERCEVLYQGCVRGTASFLENENNHPDFHKWANRESSEAVFSLTGSANTGKSHVVSSVVHYLRSMYGSPSRQLPRTLIACYFFPNVPAKSSSESSLVETALKSIALQIAESDAAYAKKLFTDCENREDIDKFLRDTEPLGLWEFLSLGAPKGSTAHYIILDGLSSLPETCKTSRKHMFDIMGQLSSSPSCVRVLLSMKPETLDSIGMGFPYIKLDMEIHTARDIGLYVDHKLKNDDILQETDENLVAIRDKIRSKLLEEVNGNYYKVNTALDRIKEIVNAGGSEEEIDHALDESNKDEKAISEEVVKKMEKTLKAEEITELNELLAWTMFGERWFDCDMLSAALSLLPSRSRSLLPLRKKLSRKYANLFEILGSTDIVRIADGMEEFVIKEKAEQRDLDDKPKFSATITISNADITSIQNFMWSFMQKSGQDNFGFEKILEHEGMKKSIGVNAFDSHLLIVRRAFQLLGEKPYDETRALIPYLLSYLPQHLEALELEQNVHTFSQAEKREIGDGLFSLFVAEDVIETHWKSCNELIWYRSRDELEIFLKWLKEKSITSHLGRLDREWLRNVIDDKNPPCALMMKVMRMVARNWLQKEDWEVGLPFKWLQGFLSSIVPENIEDNHATDDKSTDSHGPDEATVDVVASWCKQLLGAHEINLLWDERLAQTFLIEQDFSRAYEMFKSLLDRDGPKVNYLEGLAKSQGSRNDFLEACQTMEQAVSILENDDFLLKANLSEDYQLLCQWYSNLKQEDKTVEYIRKIMDLDCEKSSLFFTYLKALLQSKNDTGATNLLQELARTPQNQVQPSLFGEVFQIAGQELDVYLFERLCRVTTMHPSLFNPTVVELDRAIERARKENNTFDQSAFLLNRGVIHYLSFTESTVSHERFLSDWNECLELGVAGNWSRCPGQAFRLLCSYKFDQARDAKGSENETKHLESMKKIVKQGVQNIISTAHCYLASYYNLQNNITMSRSVVKSRIFTAFDMLTDSTIDNDWQGYWTLANCLLSCGDTLNALTAYSLLLISPAKTNVLDWLLDFEPGPEHELAQKLVNAVKQNGTIRLADQVDVLLSELDHYNDAGEDDKKLHAASIKSRLSLYPNLKEFGYFDCLCDGCGKFWNFETAINMCKYCDELGFCDECLLAFQAGKLKSWDLRILACRKDHDWLHLPRWNKDAYLEPLKGNVWDGGKLQNDTRVGGELTPIKTWLNKMKQEWEYNNSALSPDENITGEYTGKTDHELTPI